MDGIKHLILIFALYAACIINQAYFQGAFEVSEAREGVVVNEIKQYGTWILPLRHGEVVPSKPPLFHWLTAVLTPHEASLSHIGLRIVSILSAICSLIAVYVFSRSHIASSAFPISPASISVIVLATTYGFIQMSIDGRVDMLFLCLTTTAILWANSLFLQKAAHEKTKSLYTIGIILGLSILARGPLAIVTFALCLTIALSLSHKNMAETKIILKKLFSPLIIFPCALSAPWYLASKFLGKPELISRQIVFENVNRYFGGQDIIHKPFWFYLQHIWLQAFPWAFITIIAAYAFIRSGKYKQHSKTNKVILLLSAQTAIIFLFLSTASGKRKAYLLAILPHLAILTSYLIHETQEYFVSLKHRVSTFPYEQVIRILSYSLFTVSIGYVCLKGLLSLGAINFFSQSFFLGLYELDVRSLILPIVLNVACVFAYMRMRKNNVSILILTSILSIQAYVTLPSLFYLTKGESHSFQKFAQKIQEKVPSETLHIVKTKDDESFDSLLFYLGKRVLLQKPENSFGDGTYIAREKWFQAQNQDFKEASHILLSGRRLADKESRTVVVFTYKEDQLEHTE